jgi:hypothetical protein
MQRRRSDPDLPEDPALRERLTKARTTATTSAADLGPLLAGIEAELRAQHNSLASRVRSRLRDWPTPWRRLVVVMVALVLPGAAWALAPRADFQAYPAARMLLALGSLGAIASLLLVAAQRPWQRPGLSPAAVMAGVGAALLAALGLAALPAAHVLLPHTAIPPDAGLWQHAWPCLRFGLCVALPVFGASHLLARETPYATWMAAAAAGLAGNLALQLHCPITEPVHLLAGHASVGLVMLLPLAVAFLYKALQRGV